MEKYWEGLIVFLSCKDLNATHHFYSDVLGLPLYLDQGKCRIYQIPGGGMLGFCSHIPFISSEKSPILTLLTPRVDEVYDLFLSEGIQPEHEPRENPTFHIYHFFVKDPNGYWVEIQKFLN